jgi:hypothetical protein
MTLPMLCYNFRYRFHGFLSPSCDRILIILDGFKTLNCVISIIMHYTITNQFPLILLIIGFACAGSEAFQQKTQYLSAFKNIKFKNSYRNGIYRAFLACHQVGALGKKGPQTHNITFIILIDKNLIRIINNHIVFHNTK